MAKGVKIYDIPDSIIDFTIPIPIDELTGQSFEKDTFEYKLYRHYVQGIPLPDFSPFLTTRAYYQRNSTYTHLIPSHYKDSPYMKFWNNEEHKCIHGTTEVINGESWYIPGYLYWYWNFTPIHKTRNLGVNQRTGKIMAERIYDFPDVYDTDYFWFMYLHEARQRGQHAGCLKARGKGFSFKACSMLTRNFYLIPRSKGYAIADSWDYLTQKDGLLVKVSEHMSFIDDYTPFVKRRQVKDTDSYRRASFKEQTDDGQLIERGYKSEIYGISLEGKPDKVRGLRGNLLIYEESGNNSCLQNAWEVSRSSVEEGGSVYGQLISFGTGGTVGSGFTALERMVRKPDEFNIYGIPNIWERGRSSQRIAFLVPDYLNRKGHMDEHGNSITSTAIQEELAERESKKGNPSLLRQRMAEHPFTIDDAIMRVEGSPFDVSLIREQLANLDTNPLYKGAERLGKMIVKPDGTIDFKQDITVRPLTEFPTIDKEPEGCIIIYETPATDNSGITPFGWYVAGTDPINLGRDDVGDTYSLASTFVINRFTRRIVAEYTGRPRFVDTFYEQLRRLLIYYNCQTLLEVNIAGVFDHFNKMNSTHLIAETPSLFRDMNMNIRGIANNLGIKSDPQGQVKGLCRSLINKWTQEVVEENEEGQPIYMMYRIRSKPLLQELKDWSRTGNYDRVDALGYALLHLEQKVKHSLERETSTRSTLADPYWNILTPNNATTQPFVITRDGTIQFLS